MDIIFLLLGAILGAILVYFILKGSSVPRAQYEQVNQQYIEKESDFRNLQQNAEQSQMLLKEQKLMIQELETSLSDVRNTLAKSSAERDSLYLMLEEQRRNTIEQTARLENLNNDKQELFAKNSELLALNEGLRKSLESQKEEVLRIQEESKLQFENIANKILEEKTEKFTTFNKENIKNLLMPLQEKIVSFEKKVEDTHKESIDYHSALRQQIIGLKDLNMQMSKEALNLTRALKGDNKIQGNWGELILERVLEKSGLEKGREYDIQKSHSTEDGRLQPDVIINLPDGKKMIIDSKVSLNAYERFVNQEDTELKRQYLKEHLFSLTKHIEQLSQKNYQSLYQIESPDFVLLFIPMEPAFAVALGEDAQLYNRAFDKNIVIVTPSTLLATLKTIDSMWANQKRQDNALKIAKQAGALYDKFEGFVGDLINIGKKMDAAKSDYEKAMNKLVSGRGNMVKTAEKIRTMGAKTTKVLPESLVSRAESDENDTVPFS